MQLLFKETVEWIIFRPYIQELDILMIVSKMIFFFEFFITICFDKTRDRKKINDRTNSHYKYIKFALLAGVLTSTAFFVLILCDYYIKSNFY